MRQESFYVRELQYETQDLPPSLQPDIFQLQEAEALKLPSEQICGLTRFQVHCMLARALCRKVGAQAHPRKRPMPLGSLGMPVIGPQERQELFRHLQQYRTDRYEHWNALLDVGIKVEDLEQMTKEEAVEAFQARIRSLLLENLAILQMESYDQEESKDLSLETIETTIAESYLGWKAGYIDGKKEKSGIVGSIEIDPQNDVPHLTIVTLPPFKQGRSESQVHENAVSLVHSSQLNMLHNPLEHSL